MTTSASPTPHPSSAPAASTSASAPSGSAAPTAPSAPSAASPSPAPPAWQLAALFRPAIIRTGSAVSTAARFALERIFQAAVEAMELTLDRPVAFDLPTDPSALSAAAPAWGMTFSHPALDAPGGARREGLIAIDAALARTILDAMETDFANLRGAGNLTEVESGLLEYVGLACTDHVLRSVRPARGVRGFAIGRFLKPQELADWTRQSALSPGLISLRIAGRGGLPWSAASPSHLALPASPRPGPARRTRVRSRSRSRFAIRITSGPR